MGVSPTGYLVGVFSMGPTLDVTSGDYETLKGEDDMQRAGDDGALKHGSPNPQPDGLPAQTFFNRKIESMLSSKLMLWANDQGIVLFEGMLPTDVLKSHADPDMVFLRKYEYVNYVLEPLRNVSWDRVDGILWKGMAKGGPHSHIFRFIVIPEKPYTSTMPTGFDVIRELRNEEN